MSELFIDAILGEGLDGVGSSLAKRGAFGSHVKALHTSHAAMAKFHKAKHDALDDGHEDKMFHKMSAAHHEACAAVYKSLGEDLGGESSGDFGETTGDLHGPEKSRRGDQIRPDGVRVAYPTVDPSLRLVPRAGSAQSFEKAAVDANLEELFGGI